MLIIGVDPGIKGGIFAMCCTDKYEYKHTVSYFSMPILESTNRIDSNKLFNIIDSIVRLGKDEEVLIILEQQQPMGKEGLTSMMTIGFNYGLVYAACAACTSATIIEYRPVNIANAVKGWTKNFVTKQKAINQQFAKYIYGKEHDIFKSIKPKRTPHEGIIDASVIAYYGMMRQKKLSINKSEEDLF